MVGQVFLVNGNRYTFFLLCIVYIPKWVISIGSVEFPFALGYGRHHKPFQTSSLMGEPPFINAGNKEDILKNTKEITPTAGFFFFFF